MLQEYQLYIDGQWIGAGESFPTINPYDRQEWATIPQASDTDVAGAVAAARRAFETSWGQTSGLARSTLLLRLADVLDRDAQRMGELETRDNGKVIRETVTQMHFAARQYRFYAGYADKLWGSVIPLDQRDVFDYASREPLGIVVLIIAWNSPMSLLANKLAPALAAGNCVVIKPSEHASATTLEFCSLVAEAGFPPGVINVVTGDFRVGRALVGAQGIDRVSFTGSPAVGRDIAATAGRNLVPVTLELGGKSPNIVFGDADFEKAAVGALAGIFGATGQTCIAGSRLLVHRSLYGRMSEYLAERAGRIVLGNPADVATEMGTAANEPQFRRILDCIDAAKAEGAKLLSGGSPAIAGDLANGFFVQPTIFNEVRNGMSIAQEEVFGPVLSIIPFETDEEAITIGNDTRYGLAAGIWTQDVTRIMRVSRALRSGVVWVNTYRAPAVQAPFGGVKESGFGRERGAQGLDEFMTYKNVMIDYSGIARDPFTMRA